MQQRVRLQCLGVTMEQCGIQKSKVSEWRMRTSKSHKSFVRFPVKSRWRVTSGWMRQQLDGPSQTLRGGASVGSGRKSGVRCHKRRSRNDSLPFADWPRSAKFFDGKGPCPALRAYSQLTQIVEHLLSVQRTVNPVSGRAGPVPTLNCHRDCNFAAPVAAQLRFLKETCLFHKF